MVRDELPCIAAPLPESLDRWLDPENRKLAALWATGGLLAHAFLLWARVRRRQRVELRRAEARRLAPLMRRRAASA